MSAPEQQPAEASAASASSDAAAAAAAEAAAASTWSSGGSIAPGSTPLASPDEKQRNMAGMYPQLEGMLRGAALMHENFSSSEESESDSESDDDDAIAEADEHYFLSEDDEHSTVPASSGTSSDAHPAPALAAPAQEGDDGWARRREEAAQADAHAKHRRKAMLKRLTKARNRIQTGARHAPTRPLDEDEAMAWSLQQSAMDSLDEASADHRSIMDTSGDSDSQEAEGSAAREAVQEDMEGKLAAFQAEFGPSGLDGRGEEKLIAIVPAVLTRRVLIKGSLCLSNHRLAFVAWLPSPGADGHPSAAGAAPIKRGPATFHRHGLHRKKRVWLELRPDAITGFRSSTALYKPLGSMRLGDIDELLPHDWAKGTHVDVRSKGRLCTFEFETEEASLTWHREIEAAIWAFQKTADKIKICIPLPRILTLTHSAYLHFATTIWLSVLDEGGEPRASQQGSSAPTIELAFGVTSRHLGFLESLEPHIAQGKKWREEKGLEHTLKTVPRPLLDIEGPRSKEQELNHAAAESDGGGLASKFVQSFSLSCSANELRLVKADIVRTVPWPGTLAISPSELIFWRRRLGNIADIRVKIPLADIVNAEEGHSFFWRSHGLRLEVRGHPDLHFDIGSAESRDAAKEAIMSAVKEHAAKADAQPKKPSTETPPLKRYLEEATRDMKLEFTTEQLSLLPKVIGGDASDEKQRKLGRMRIALMTIGSRGDVQPQLALALRLKADGHDVYLCSHPEYKDWVAEYGLELRPIGGDPGALMKLSVENKLFSPAFFRDQVPKFRLWLDELLREIFEAAHDADLIIEAPQTMGGIHVAEATGAYYMRAFTMPWTKCTAYPQAFSVPPFDMGPQYNAMSYALFDRVFWQASSGQINRWRKHMLKLGPTTLDLLDQQSVPFLYNFSPSVVPPPLDWGDRIQITGYWTIESDSSKAYEPPEELTKFLKQARQEEKKLVYIGFGSIPLSHPRDTMEVIYESVKKADVRAIVAKGWSGRMEDGSSAPAAELEVPEQVYLVDSIPHDWLFPQIDIAFHHGGAGTVGASLGAGLVTLVHPFFGDQFFWARRVARLNAGLTVSDLTSQQAVTEALVTARDDRIMVEKAAAVGESIRKEKGTEEAVKFIYANLSISKRTRVPLQKRSKTLPRISALPLIGDVGKSSSDDGSKSSPVSPQVEEPGARSPDPEAAPPSPDSASKRRSFASRGLDSLRRVASPLGVSSPSGRSTPQAPEDGASHAEPRSSTDGHAAKKSDEHDSKQHAAPKRSSTLGLHLPSLPILHKRAATVSDTSDLGMGPLDTTRSLDDALAPKRSNTTEQRRTHKTAKLEDQRRRALLEEKLRGRCKPESDDDDEHGRDGTGWGHEHRVRHRKVREEECAEHAAAAH